MPKYKLKKDHFLQDKKLGIEPQHHAQGETVEWPGQPSLHMEPLDKEATERSQARIASFDEKKRAAMAGRASVGWNRTFGENMARIVSQEPAKHDAPPQSASGAARRNKKAA